jgi:PAS domain-containing protein
MAGAACVAGPPRSSGPSDDRNRAGAGMFRLGDRYEAKGRGSPVDRNEKEAASPDGEELLRIIVESSTDFAIFAMDAAGTVISWNIGAERLTGYAEHEILGRSGDVIFTAEDRAARAPSTSAMRRWRPAGPKTIAGICTRTALVFGAPDC